MKKNHKNPQWEGRERRPRWNAWDEHIFDEPTADGAYILGFIVADGSISNSTHTERGTKSYVITIHQKDFDILHRVASVLDFQGKLLGAGNSSTWGLYLGSKYAWHVVTEKYQIPAGKAKSYTVRIPPMILENKQALPHFIRGVFDGDGYLSKNGYQFGLSSGSEGLMEDFIDVLVNEVGLPRRERVWEKGGYRKKDGTQSGCWFVRWSSPYDSMHFAKYIYGPSLDVYGSDLFLERKKERFDQLFVPWRDYDWLTEEFIKGGRFLSDIAAEFGVNTQAVVKAAKEFGFKTMIMRVCEQCGKEFEIRDCEAKRGGGHFCSRKCQGVAARRDGMWYSATEVVCAYCGRMFTRLAGRLDQRFCSRDCARFTQIALGRVAILCGQCGQIFEVKTSVFVKSPSKRFSCQQCRQEKYLVWERIGKTCVNCAGDISGKGDLFCSRDCRIKWQKRNNETRICEICQKEFEITPSEIAKGGGRFCSQQCLGEKYPRIDKMGICEYCEEDFERKHRDQKYCSNECRHLAHRKRVGCVCEHCGNQFWTHLSNIKRGGGRFCSVECCDAVRVNKVKQICGMCGRTFEVKPSQIKYGGAKYCSNECKGAARSVLNTITMRCEYCDRLFDVIRAKFLGRRFCSRKCFDLARRMPVQQLVFTELEIGSRYNREELPNCR